MCYHYLTIHLKYFSWDTKMTNSKSVRCDTDLIMPNGDYFIIQLGYEINSSGSIDWIIERIENGNDDTEPSPEYIELIDKVMRSNREENESHLNYVIELAVENDEYFDHGFDPYDEKMMIKEFL